MRGSTLVRKVAGTAVAVVTGLVFLAGCGADPAHLTGTAPGGGGGGSTGDGTTPDPGDSANPGGSAGPGATEGTGGGGGTGGGSTNAIKPCTIVTNQDANQATDATLNNTSNTDEECAYESGDNAVELAVQAEAYDAATVNEISQLGPMVKKVDGLGDAAYQISVAESTQFHVWTKGKYVVVIVTRVSGDTAGPARVLLDKVLAKI